MTAAQHARQRVLDDGDIFDSRDLIEIANEIEAEDEADRDDEDKELLAAIKEMEEVGAEDWNYGATFIHERYFTEYAQQLAEDLGAIDPDASWPLCHIDWSEAAASLKQDYTTVEFLGNTYYVR